MVTHAARESDEEGALKMEAEQQTMGLEKPPVHYVDAAYVSTEKLVWAAAEGRELIGPAPQCANNNEAVFRAKISRSRWSNGAPPARPGSRTPNAVVWWRKPPGQVSYRFEWDTATCAACPLRLKCIKAEHKHRTLVVGENHTRLAGATKRATNRRVQSAPEASQCH